MLNMMKLNMLKRITGAVVLDGRIYEEVAAHREAIGQALLVVVLVAVATGLGVFDEEGYVGLITWIVLSLVGWVVWTSLTYLIGGMLLATPQTNADWGRLARALGFAQAPGVLRVLGIIPGTGVAIALVSVIWQFIAMTVAVRHVLNYASYWRAVGVMAIAFIPYVVIVSVISLILIPS